MQSFDIFVASFMLCVSSSHPWEEKSGLVRVSELDLWLGWTSRMSAPNYRTLHYGATHFYSLVHPTKAHSAMVHSAFIGRNWHTKEKYGTQNNSEKHIIIAYCTGTQSRPSTVLIGYWSKWSGDNSGTRVEKFLTGEQTDWISQDRGFENKHKIVNGGRKNSQRVRGFDRIGKE